MRPSGIRRLLLVMLAMVFAWPLPAAGNEPTPDPTSAVGPSPSAAAIDSPAPSAEPQPTPTAPPTPAPSTPTEQPSADPAAPDDTKPSPASRPADRDPMPAPPNQAALGGLDDDGTFSTLSCTGAIIDNGFIQLGVNPEGHLNVPCGTASSGTGTTYVGVRYQPAADNTEATAPGWS